ncbi:hypothetical protein [Dyadobacter sandarakinus]|uniref:SnoaL-like domain-containing protein n=1 Tax=Dyadobacter sandarakinus TaxID=2747268 RepID=A0ABX7I4D1_9BACT|nr:hypothetical protein [Dyadobacter sandarakinus]QRR00568.1 hypothetical protein HWI92_06435 [Dyadobacter sandarakinus]
MSISNLTVEKFVAAYGEALSRADVRQISGFWAIPSLVVDEAATIAVTGSEQVEDFFQEAVAYYTHQGMVIADGTLEHFENLSDFIVSAAITWNIKDGQGGVLVQEKAHYLLQADEKGELLIRLFTPRV